MPFVFRTPFKQLSGPLSVANGGTGSGSIGAILITSGSLSGTSTIISSIPQTYAYLFLAIDSYSTGSTEEVLVQADATATGASPVTLAGSYTNYNITGTTLAAGAVASLTPATTQTAGQTGWIYAHIFGYNAGWDVIVTYSHWPNGVLYQGQTTYNGENPIQALVIKGSDGGTFDAGTYSLYGMR